MADDFYQAVLDSAPWGAVVTSTEIQGRCLYANPEFTRITGYTLDEIPTVQDWIENAYPDPEYRALILANWERDTSQMRRDVVYQVTCKDGSEKHIQLRAGPAGPSRMIVMLLDVSERVEIEHAVQDSEERYRLLVESSPLGIVLHTGDRIDFANSASVRIMGAATPEDLVGRSVLDFVHPDSRTSVGERVRDVLQQGLPAQLEQERWVRLDGTVIDVEVAGGPVQYRGQRASQVVFTDITERRQLERHQRELERRMQQAQRTESLGLLAGGVAHDLNNLLVGILGHADLARRRPDDAADVDGHLRAVIDTAERAAELAGQLLAYAGRRQLSFELVALNDVVDGTRGLLEAIVARRATLTTELAGDLPAVEADAVQLRQILINLVSNALEAGGSHITISTGRVSDREALLEAYLPHHPIATRHVLLEVADDGAGMDEDARERVFEPFFTTKATGRGLGLAAVLGIARAHGGALRVDSRPQEGTVFRLFLPVAEGTVTQRAPATPAETWCGAGVALLVDDDPVVLDVGGAMLRHAGFDVEIARNGREALDILSRDAARVVCVVLDLTMPGWSGEETLRRMRELRKDLPVVLSSGYDEADTAGRMRDIDPSGFLPKPYSYDRLLRVLRRVLTS